MLPWEKLKILMRPNTMERLRDSRRNIKPRATPSTRAEKKSF